MKKASKLSIILLILFSLFAFVACDPATYYLTPEYLSDIVRVELIRYDNPQQKKFNSWVPDHTSDLKPFDGSKLSVLETLDEDKFPQLIDALCGYDILYTYYAYDSPNGICLKLSYANGDFLIVSCDEASYAGYIGKFSADGEVVEFLGCFSSVWYFKSLVNDYFLTKI